jgi:hypothetical protein
MDSVSIASFVDFLWPQNRPSLDEGLFLNTLRGDTQVQSRTHETFLESPHGAGRHVVSLATGSIVTTPLTAPEPPGDPPCQSPR